MLKLNKVVLSVREGDQEILFTVYRRYRNEFVDWAMNNYTCSEEVARGILKQVLQSFYTNINSGRVIQLADDLKSYLFHHGKIKIVNILKPKYSSCTVGNDVDSETGPIPSPISAPKPTFPELQNLYEQFDDTSKKLLRLFYVQNLSVREVAKIMGLKNAEASRLSRRKALEAFQLHVLKSFNGPLTNFEEINNYLLGNMVAGEKALFQARLLIDPQLAAEVEGLQHAVDIFTTLDQNALLKGFSTIDSDLDEQPKSSKAKWPLVLVAGSIVFTLGFFYLFYRSAGAISRFEEEEIGLPVVMGKSNVLFDNAMSYYKMGEYRKSLEVLDQITAGKGADTLDYFRATNHYMLSNYQSAIHSLQTIEPASAFHLKATYRLGLAYWHTDQLADARRVFKRLAATNSPYQARAKQILLELAE